MKQLTQKQSDELWGETGPYSQAKLISETRILDDRVSRVFLIVEVDINPFTYRFVNKHRSAFKEDQMVQQLLDHADYRGQKFGYVSSAFCEEYTNELVMKNAQNHLEYAIKTIMRLHQFVTKNFSQQ